MSTNGWGKGSVNNTNGWGAGAINNDIGWGDSHLKSWSGDTDIDGGTGIPVNTVAPVISGTTTLGSVLTTTNGTWTAKPSATFTYQWKRNGSNIIGATNSTYTLVNDDGTTNITCQVTATNDFGIASAISNTLAIPAFTDPDAQAFITAASITDPTQQSAINTLVTDLKGYGIWTKMKALYPFVGGTASQHKWNLKDPRDLDAAFRLVFNGGWTHSSTGAKPNGTNAYAESYFTPNTEMGTNQQIAYYIGNNIAGNMIDIGSASGTDMGLWTRHASLGYVFDFPSGSVDRVTFANSDSRGNYLVFNNSTLGRGVYKGGSSIHSSSFVNKNIVDVPLRTLHLSKSVYGFYSQRELRLVAFATGFNSLTEVINFQTSIQTFNTILNRQV